MIANQKYVSAMPPVCCKTTALAKLRAVRHELVKYVTSLCAVQKTNNVKQVDGSGKSENGKSGGAPPIQKKVGEVVAAVVQ